MRSLEGRVALITGASRGIGRAMALAFGQAGASVVVTARTPLALDAVVTAVRESGREALAIPADLSLEADIERIRWGRYGGLSGGLWQSGPSGESAAHGAD
jgi:3-oxoacyl-[acyl-carrier protein] reductase